MNRRNAVFVLLALPWAVRAQTPDLGSVTSSLGDPMMKMLTSKLGVTQEQASGGMGSYLTLAKEKLAKGDFDKIASYVPGAAKYMQTAKTLGAVQGPLNNLAGLNGALGKLGISPETAAKFTPMVTDYLGKVGGSNVQQLLANVMK
jgi:Protein of unknown function VcgC/VcgE (DUF2780)